MHPLRARFRVPVPALLLSLAAAARGETVFNSSTNLTPLVQYALKAEEILADEVLLGGGLARMLTRIQFEYTATLRSGRQPTAQVFLWRNDGPPVAGEGSPTAPGTLLYASPVADLAAAPALGVFTIEGLSLEVPAAFSWGVQFGNFDPTNPTASLRDRIGLTFYGAEPLLAGGGYDDYWRRDPATGTWNTYRLPGGEPPVHFAAIFEAAELVPVPEPGAGVLLLAGAGLLWRRRAGRG
jgi:hypothetical protein